MRCRWMLQNDRRQEKEANKERQKTENFQERIYVFRRHRGEAVNSTAISETIRDYTKGIVNCGFWLSSVKQWTLLAGFLLNKISYPLQYKFDNVNTGHRFAASALRNLVRKSYSAYSSS